MSKAKKLALFVEITLLKRSLVVIILAHCIAVIPLNSSLTPPIVRRIWCFSAFSGHISATNFLYATFLSVGVAFFGTKNIMLLPDGIRSLTPCARRPRSLANALIHMFCLGPSSGFDILSVYL